MSTAMTKTEGSQLEHVAERPAVVPRVDIFENQNEIILVADMPGVSETGLKIDLDQETLSIDGRCEERTGSGALHREFRVVDYRRSFTLPGTIERSKIEAVLKDGVLTLHLPKSDAVRPRRIEVRAG